MNEKISIIIPVFNEEKYIEDCIKSVINFKYPKEFLEIIFVDGNSDDDTVKIIKKYVENDGFIKVIFNEKKIVPISMNLGIKEANGDYICRIDAHAKYPEDYIFKLLKWSKKLNADNVGGVCFTDVKSNTYTARAIKFVMSDKFGVGNSLFRIGTNKPIEVDTVPFGFYKREVFNKIGLYDERLVRVQDLELNKRLKKNNGKIFLIPDVECTYFPRENLKSIYKNRFQTGRWVILASYLTNSLKSISIRHLVPLIFSLSIILSLVLAGFHVFFLFFCFFLLVFYSILLFTRALVIKKFFILSINILIAYFVVHFSYGLGSLKAIFEIPFMNKKK